MSTLAKRLLFGTLMVLVLAALLLADGYLGLRGGGGVIITLLGAGLLAKGAIEICNLFSSKGLRAPVGLLMPGAILVAALPLWRGRWGLLGGVGQAELLALLVMGVLLLGGLWQGIRIGPDGVMGNLGALMLGTSYLGLGMFFTLRIRLLGIAAEGVMGQTGALLLFLFTVKSSDIGAYLIGRKLGRHKWVPSISPGKTWEGLAGGLVLAAIVASILNVVFDIMSVGGAIGFGLVIGLVGQLGDLLESMFKRDAVIKDSAALVPEFGGVLDLIDSVLVAAPLGYVLLALTAGV